MIKDVVVHLTGSKEDSVRLSYAELVVRTFDGHLTGLQIHSLPEIISYTDPAGSGLLQELLAESYQRAQETTDTLKDSFSRYEFPHDLRRIDAYTGAIGDELARETRTADLFVGTRPYGDPDDRTNAEEAVLFKSGRGCLFVPPNGKPPKQFSTVFVAWKDSREAARAVAEALPFLMKARQVVVGLFEEHGPGEEFRIEAAADIGRYLSRHGISAEVRKLAGWTANADALANEARQVGADMIVMGGYGHSRFREWLLGGATRQLLSTSDIPILMAH